MHRANATSSKLLELPLYRNTKCGSCGADEGLTIRYNKTSLCVDCYRRARRAGRGPDRPLERLVRRAMIAALEHAHGRSA